MKKQFLTAGFLALAGFSLEASAASKLFDGMTHAELTMLGILTPEQGRHAATVVGASSTIAELRTNSQAEYDAKEGAAYWDPVFTPIVEGEYKTLVGGSSLGLKAKAQALGYDHTTANVAQLVYNSEVYKLTTPAQREWLADAGAADITDTAGGHAAVVAAIGGLADSDDAAAIGGHIATVQELQAKAYVADGARVNLRSVTAKNADALWSDITGTMTDAAKAAMTVANFTDALTGKWEDAVKDLVRANPVAKFVLPLFEKAADAVVGTPAVTLLSLVNSDMAADDKASIEAKIVVKAKSSLKSDVENGGHTKPLYMHIADGIEAVKRAEGAAGLVVQPHFVRRAFSLAGPGSDIGDAGTVLNFDGLYNHLTAAAVGVDLALDNVSGRLAALAAPGLAAGDGGEYDSLVDGGGGAKVAGLGADAGNWDTDYTEQQRIARQLLAVYGASGVLARNVFGPIAEAFDLMDAAPEPLRDSFLRNKNGVAYEADVQAGLARALYTLKLKINQETRAGRI